ncbi:MAG: (d)CMP kinase [Bryobacteraceae bacterium]|nr:(d)CMP kinase [Bryobacteraceae bacterium]
MDKIIIVAIDGPAGAGKSTIARSVAARLGFLYIDTGAMYRAIALWALRTGTSLEDMHRLEALAVSADLQLDGPGKISLNGEDISDAIREPAISEAASKVAAIAGVRRALVEKQQLLGESTSVVMEGRDIGTVVFPEAQVKFYLDASANIRADRRAQELADRGQEVSVDDLVREIEDRDRRDRARAHSPLRQAEDAVYLDTSSLSPVEVEDEILRVVRARTSNGKSLTRQHVE